MKNVKSMTGQVWKENQTGNDYVIDIHPEGWINGQCKTFGFSGYSESALLQEFTFQPQTDLEWLAVYEPEWKADKFLYIRRDTDLGVMYHNIPNNRFKWYTREEWQNKRYELGLDERPTELNEIENTHKTIYIPPQYINCPCTLTPLKKEPKMIDLSTAKVGDEFVLNNGTVVRFFARTKMNSICELDSGHAMVYHHNGVFDESVESDDYKYNWNIAAKHDPRHWLKDLPDAELFSLGWLSCDKREGWFVSSSEPFKLNEKDNYHSITGGTHKPVSGINMPTLTDDQWKESKISIPDLKALQEANK